eukprot:gene2511-3109_t
MDGDQSTQKPASTVLCANQCGFWGNPLTENLCSKCYRDLRLKDGKKEEEKTKTEEKLDATVKPTGENETDTSSTVPTKKVQTDTTKCFSCSKKVGLLGFKCRCDYVFCSSHRYSDKHDCTFDYKAVGKAALAKANPVVSGTKITKI